MILIVEARAVIDLVTPPKKNGLTRRPSFLGLVEVARIELASGSTLQSGLHA